MDVTAPVLFYSGKNITNERLDEAMRAGAQGFLAKAADVNALEDSLGFEGAKPPQFMVCLGMNLAGITHDIENRKTYAGFKHGARPV